MEIKTKYRKVLVYILTIVFSSIFLFAANKYIMRDFSIFTVAEDSGSAKAAVLNITDRHEYKTNYYADGEYVEGIEISFNCRILDGEHENEIVRAVQKIDSFDNIKYKEVETGDKVILYNVGGGDSKNIVWDFAEYIRTDNIILLGIVFLILLILFGGIKGVNTIVSLLFTCLAVFFVFIPSVLSGHNIYVWSIITCLFTIVMTLLIVNGANKKSIAAMSGCFIGVLIAGVLTIFMSRVLMLTGMVNEEAVYITMIDSSKPIDLKAIIFAAIIIGAMGAVMDVAMSVSSSLYELYRKANVKSVKSLIGSGFSIGRDIMGTMANTLVLAYIGSSLSTVLLLVTYNTSYTELFNREMVIVEILQSLVGSMGILAAIPLTSVICGVFYVKVGKK